MISPPQEKKKSQDKSFFSSVSLSTRPEITKKVQKHIELDDFVDFNEDSLINSIKSNGSNNCEFFYPQQTNPFSKVY